MVSFNSIDLRIDNYIFPNDLTCMKCHVFKFCVKKTPVMFCQQYNDTIIWEQKSISLLINTLIIYYIICKSNIKVRTQTIYRLWLICICHLKLFDGMIWQQIASLLEILKMK